MEQGIKSAFYKSIFEEPLMFDALLNGYNLQMSVEVAKVRQNQLDRFVAKDEDENADYEDALLIPESEIVIKLMVNGNLSTTISQEISDRSSLTRPTRLSHGEESIKISNHIFHV